LYLKMGWVVPQCGKMWMYEEAKVTKENPEYESWFYKFPITGE